VTVHVGRHRPRPVESDQGGHIVERGGGQGAHQRAHRPPFELEHAHRVALAEHEERRFVVEGDVVDVGTTSGRNLDEVEGALDDGEIPQPEEVHLEQPEIFDAVHLVLGHDWGVARIVVVRLALNGDILGKGQVGDDYRRGMDAVPPAQSFEPLGHVDDLFGIGVRLVHGAQLGRRREAVLEALDLGQAGR